MTGGVGRLTRILRGLERRIERRWPLRSAARVRAAPPRAGLRPDLVIPCHNDAEGLTRLLARVRRLGCFARVIVVDDGSDTPVEQVIGGGADLTILRHETPRGGGVARNARLREHIAGSKALSKLHQVFPPLDLCSDNGAMIAGLGHELLRRGETSDLDLRPVATSRREP